MGTKTKIAIAIIEIGAMVALKIIATKHLHKILPAGARVRKFPDGTPVVRQENPAYTNQPPPEKKYATYLPRSEGALDKGLRAKARRFVRRWKLPRRNQLHKSHRRNNGRKTIYAILDNPLGSRALPADKQLDETNR
jgi:hypothetical protein